MERYVISVQRSGLNWTRFCVEYFYGLRTPGKPLLIDETDDPDVAFERTHDAMYSTAKSGAFMHIDPARTAGDKVLLILRDPLETYVRKARKNLAEMKNYIGNIRIFDQAVTSDKMVAYYDEIVGDPRRMFEVLSFLDLTPAAGKPVPTVEMLVENWDAAGEASRRLYSKNQWHSGGAKTRRNPLDFKFHQKRLTVAQKEKLWTHLEAELTASELALIARFRPEGGFEATTIRDRLSRWF